MHAHTLCLDGVYVCDDEGTPVFHPLPEPTADEVEDVARRTAERAARILERHGRSVEPGDDCDALAEQPALASCYAAAARGLGLFGPRAGQPTLRLVELGRARADEPVAVVQGFNVHAKVAVDGRDRKRLERLCPR